MKKAVLIRQGKKVGQRFFWRKQTKRNLIKKLIMRKEKKSWNWRGILDFIITLNVLHLWIILEEENASSCLLTCEWIPMGLLSIWLLIAWLWLLNKDYDNNLLCAYESGFPLFFWFIVFELFLSIILIICLFIFNSLSLFHDSKSHP